MTGFLARSRTDPRANTAFHLAAVWGPGQTVHGFDAVGHAVIVTNMLGRYAPDAPPQVVAACLLHAIPRWPMSDEAVHEFVEAHCGVEARLLLAALRAEHAVLAMPTADAVEGHLRLLRRMPWLAHVTLTFKIVALQYATTHGAGGRGGEATARSRAYLDEQMPYLRQLHALATEVVPPIMTFDFVSLLDQYLVVATATASRQGETSCT